MKWTLDFDEIDITLLPQVGGKNASLGEMFSKLKSLGIKIPNGFATTADAFRTYLKSNSIDTAIYELLNQCDISDIISLKKTSEEIQKIILNGKFSDEFKSAVINA